MNTFEMEPITYEYPMDDVKKRVLSLIRNEIRRLCKVQIESCETWHIDEFEITAINGRIEYKIIGYPQDIRQEINGAILFLMNSVVVHEDINSNFYGKKVVDTKYHLDRIDVPIFSLDFDQLTTCILSKFYR